VHISPVQEFKIDFIRKIAYSIKSTGFIDLREIMQDKISR